MAFHLETTTLSIADNDALTFPDADWSFAFWARFQVSLESTTSRVFALWGADGAAPSIAFVAYDPANATYPGRLRFNIKDADGESKFIITSGATITGSTAWQHAAIVRSGADLTFYVNAASRGTTKIGTVDAINVAEAWTFQAPQRVYEFADVATWNRALSVGEIANQVAGQSPLRIPLGLSWVMPGEKTAGAWKRDQDSGLWTPLTVTNNGATITDGPNVERFEHRITGRKSGLLGIGA